MAGGGECHFNAHEGDSAACRSGGQSRNRRTLDARRRKGGQARSGQAAVGPAAAIGRAASSRRSRCCCCLGGCCSLRGASAGGRAVPQTPGATASAVVATLRRGARCEAHHRRVSAKSHALPLAVAREQAIEGRGLAPCAAWRELSRMVAIGCSSCSRRCMLPWEGRPLVPCCGGPCGARCQRHAVAYRPVSVALVRGGALPAGEAPACAAACVAVLLGMGAQARPWGRAYPWKMVDICVPSTWRKSVGIGGPRVLYRRLSPTRVRVHEARRSPPRSAPLLCLPRAWSRAAVSCSPSPRPVSGSTQACGSRRTRAPPFCGGRSSCRFPSQV